jgi:hypothetical protein
MGLLNWLRGGADKAGTASERHVVSQGSENDPALALLHEHPALTLLREHPIRDTGEDSAELVTTKPARDHPNVAGLLVHFHYVDASGNESRRSVRCERCWTTNNALYVRGHCSLRHADRTFRVDQMSNVIEVRTKKPIPDPTAYFFPLADREGQVDYDDEATGFHGRGDRLFDARRVCIDGLNVLARIVLLRGPVRQDDKINELTYVAYRLDDCGIPRDDGMLGELLAFALALAPTDQTFRNAVEIVAADKRNFDAVAETINEITGRSVDADNQALLAAVREVIAVGKARGLVE